MALPTNFDLVTVSGTYVNLDGTPASGTITFSANVAGNTFLKDAGADVLVLPMALSQNLDAKGSFSIDLPATDDPDIVPSGFSYTVTERFANGSRTYSITVPVAGGPVDLVTVAPTQPATASVQLVTKDQVGAPNGVASLDGQGLLTASQRALGWVSARDHGATGNGTTDDTAATQAALDAVPASGGTVYLPAGTYAIQPNPGLLLKSNTTLIGDGVSTVITIPDATNVEGNLVHVESVSHCTVRDLVIDGNRANQNPTTPKNYGLYVGVSTDCSVINVVTRSCSGVGTHVYGSTGVRAVGCLSYDNGYHGYEYEQAVACSLTGSRGTGNDLHGFALDPGEVGGTGSHGNAITGNVFDTNSEYGINVGPSNQLTPGLTQDNTITGNAIRNNALYGVCLYTQDGVTFTGNTVSGNGYFGLFAYKSSSNVITGNEFHNNSQAGAGSYDEIRVQGSSDGLASANNLIVGNTILIDGATKARWAIAEDTATDGPNTIRSNVIPYAGTAGRIQSLCIDDSLDSPPGTQQVVNGKALPAGGQGLDNAFNILRIFSDGADSSVQVVSNKTGDITFWINGASIGRFGDGGVFQHQGSQLAFYDVPPVTRPALSYSRSTDGETAALAALRTALASLGLIADNTTT